MMTDTPETSKSSGPHTHSEEDRNGMLSEASRRQLREVFSRAKSSQPPDDMKPLFAQKELTPNMFRTRQHGSVEDAGNPLTTKRKPSESLPSLSRQSRRQQNLQCEQWRSGFGQLMVAASSAFNRAFGKVDLDLWAGALCEYDLIDLSEGFADFIKSPEGFPTPGKAETFIKKRRQGRLGIVVR